MRTTWTHVSTTMATAATTATMPSSATVKIVIAKTPKSTKNVASARANVGPHNTRVTITAMMTTTDAAVVGTVVTAVATQAISDNLSSAFNAGV